MKGSKGCTMAHTGTSAAAPIAAGLVALMLDVRPCLTWRDVQFIIVITAVKVSTRNTHTHLQWKETQPFQCWGYFLSKHKDAKNRLNPVMLVFIGKLSLSTLKWLPICKGFSHFKDFLHHFVCAKLATCSIRLRANFDNTKLYKKSKIETLAHGYSSESP